MMCKIDGGLVGILSVQERAPALVRVRNVFQLNYISRAFEVVGEFPFIRAIGIMCDLDGVRALGRMNEVEFVASQSKVTALTEDADEAGRENSGADEAISQFAASDMTGLGVRLCVMDTGVSPHSDLCVPRDRIVEFVDFIGEKEHAYDDNGHGTFVAGVAAGNGLLSGREICGVAPDADIVGVKVIGETGETGTFKILDGMQWLFDNHRRLGIKVACMSFGADPVAGADPLKIGAEMLTRSGVTVVCASGNSGAGSLKSPGVSPEVISVGAADEDLKVASFTSSGTYQGVFRPDVYSPGVHVKGIAAGKSYSYMTGTSVSAPYVAGACCLLHQKYKGLTPAQAKFILTSASKVIDGARIFALQP